MHYLFALQVVLALLIVAGACYTVFALISVKQFFSLKRLREQPVVDADPPVSILKPIRGMDPGCQENLLSFCIQDYPHYEVLFGFREGNDPAIPIANKTVALGLCDARLVVDSQGSGPNQKVLNLCSLVSESQYPLVAISDSDMIVGKGYLRSVIAEFMGGRRTGLVTCLYKISNPVDVGSALESLTVGLDFLPSVLVARRLEGVTFGLGASMVVSKDALHQIGGLQPICDYLADDYQLGFRLWKKGYANILSRYVIENRVGHMSLADHISHQLRWARTYKVSRPKGFLGYGITHMVPFAVLFAGTDPGPWSLAVVGAALALRYALGFTVYSHVIRVRGWLKWLALLPLKELTGFIIWIWSFAGSTVRWRGRRYHVLADGKIVRA